MTVLNGVIYKYGIDIFTYVRLYVSFYPARGCKMNKIRLTDGFLGHLNQIQTASWSSQTFCRNSRSLTMNWQTDQPRKQRRNWTCKNRPLTTHMCDTSTIFLSKWRGEKLSLVEMHKSELKKTFYFSLLYITESMEWNVASHACYFHQARVTTSSVS